MTFLITMILVAFSLPIVRFILERQHRISVLTAAKELGQIITYHFAAQPCGRCLEADMQLLSVSPNGRSIKYKCQHCEKNMNAPAGTPDALSSGAIFSAFRSRLDSFNKRYKKSAIDVSVVFRAAETPLPFEKTRREHIFQAVRAHVWRRDGGACVECESKENLEFDHIIPVSKGGATSAENLQLLCKACNLQKGSKI